MAIPRIRTIPESAALIKELDEHSCLTQCAIRRLVLEGKIKSVKAGRKILINFDNLLEYLENPFLEDDPEEATPAKASTITPDRMESFKQNIGLIK
ncbi:MAG: hypothetical protein PWP30_2169 [Eubacteriaceae bacterium]|nr:hypothetical protein [Eubacteriaceae bacterium]